MGHDAIMLDLDAEWDGLAVRLVLGPCGSAYAAKPREIRVKGRTVQNLWPAFNYADHGVTGSTDDTGLITMSGTADASSPSIKSIKIDLTEGKTSITPA